MERGLSDGEFPFVCSLLLPAFSAVDLLRTGKRFPFGLYPGEGNMVSEIETSLLGRRCGNTHKGRAMRGTLRWYDYILLGLISSYLFLVIQQMPLFYDEAYNLQVPLTLLKEQKYATIYRVRAFDGFTTITTGPTVLIPTFLVFKFLGVGVLQARIVQFLYVTATIWIFWFLALRHFNRGVGLILILILYSIPQLRLMLSVMGEVPAIFFVLSGIALWGWNKKTQNIAVLVMGFSVITKLYFGLMLLSVILFVLIKAVRAKRPSILLIKEILVVSFLFVLPLVMFEFIKLIWLGSRDYLLYLKELLDFAESQHMTWRGSAVEDIMQFAAQKFAIFSKGLLPGLPVWFVGVLWIGIAAVSIKKIIDVNRHLELSLSFLVFATYLLWFMFVDASSWWRHISPFSFLFLLLLGDFIHTILSFFSGSRLVQILLVIILICIFSLCVLPFVVRQYISIQDFPYQLSSQKDFADEVKKYLDQGYQIGVDGWWQAPEIAFLAGGAKFIPFDCSTKPGEKFLVIYTALEEALDPERAKIFKSCLGEELFKSKDGSFILYRPLSKEQ